MHEHLPCPATVLSDVVLDYGVSTVEALLVPQSIEYALGGMALLPLRVEVFLEYPVNDSCVRTYPESQGVGRLLR